MTSLRAWWLVALATAVVGSAAPDAAAQSPAGAAAPPPIRRWVDVQQLQLSSRFRWVKNGEGRVTSSTLQWQPQIRARFLVDPEARVSVHVGAFGGSSFTSGWNNTGGGIGEFGGAFHVKQLYLNVAPGRGVQLQAGSLYLLRGENTEITSYDNDGFIEGERIAWSPSRGPITDIAITAGFLGDLSQPDAFHRIHRLGDWNYGQALVAWRMGARLTASADYTYDNGRDVLRQGITLRLPDRVKLLRAIKVDAYQRVSPNADAGFDAAADVQPLKALRITAGVETIDRAYGSLNADRYLTGTHAYMLGTYRLTRDLSAGWFHEEALGHHAGLPIAHRFEVFVTLNPTERLRALGAI